MKLYSYVVRNDIGVAPNPFWDYCTIAICTPNHMGIQAKKGDWIIGTSPISTGSKLIYAMEVSEILPFEDYYSDVRFEKKKPHVNGSWQERCGDNMYFKDQQGNWLRHLTNHHCSPENFTQDLKNPYVFIAEYFYYFGEKAIKFPDEYKELIWTRQGCKCDHDYYVVQDFLKWLKANYQPGILGNPSNNDEIQRIIGN